VLVRSGEYWGFTIDGSRCASSRTSAPDVEVYGTVAVENLAANGFVLLEASRSRVSTRILGGAPGSS
jgi:hypothetical protein